MGVGSTCPHDFRFFTGFFSPSFGASAPLGPGVGETLAPGVSEKLGVGESPQGESIKRSLGAVDAGVIGPVINIPSPPKSSKSRGSSLVIVGEFMAPSKTEKDSTYLDIIWEMYSVGRNHGTKMRKVSR